ncbi:MAG: BlaI/MecI/CopY family transcriptional regulator [bacterium]
MRSVSKSESLVMSMLYQLKEASVYQLLEKVADNKGWKYTTVLTLLQRLELKGYITARREGKGNVYTPVYTPEEFFERIVEETLGSLLETNPNPLISYLLKRKKISKKDEKLLRKILGADEGSV